MLTISNLDYCYNKDRYLFKGLSLNINRPGIYFLGGKNGDGKSTLFKIIKGIIKVKNDIIINGINNDFEKVTYIDYKYLVNNRLTVYEYLKLFCDDNTSLTSLLDEFLLSHVKDKKPKLLSDGEKTRLSFLQGILEGNNIILLDEIFSHLDKESTNIIIKWLYNLSKEKVIIMTSHKDSIEVNYDVCLKIVDKNIEVTSVDFHEYAKSFILNTNVVDYKKIRKIIEFKLRYVFLLFILILSLFTINFLYISSYSNSAVEYKMIHESESIPYVITKDYNGKLDSYLHDDINISLNSNIEMIVNSDKRKPLMMTYDIADIHNLEDFFKIERLFITDKYNDIILKDNEIVISDFLYNYIIRNNRKYPNTYIVNDKGVYLKLKYFDAKVVGVVNTGFNEKAEILSGPFGFEMLNLNEYRANYLYYMIYMNRNTYNNIINGQTNLIKNSNLYTSIDDYENSYNLCNANDLTIIDGNLPRNENEIVLPISLSLFNKIGDNTNILLIPANEDDFDYISGEKTLNCRTFRLIDKKKIVGYTIDNSFGFYNNESIEKYYKSYTDSYSVEAINKDNFTYEDYLNIKNQGYRVMLNNLKDIDHKVSLFNVIKNNNLVLGYSTLTLTLIIIILYLILEYNLLHKDIYCLKQKNISNKIINKIYFNYNFKSIIVFLILLSCSLFILFYTHCFEYIIYKLLNI